MRSRVLASGSVDLRPRRDLLGAPFHQESSVAAHASRGAARPSGTTTPARLSGDTPKRALTMSLHGARPAAAHRPRALAMMTGRSLREQ